MSESRLGARRMYGAGKPCIRTFELFVPRRQGAFAKLRKLHHKVMVIDELIVVAGSFNYTEPANEYNDENIFVMGSTHSEVAGVDVEANPCHQLAILERSLRPLHLGRAPGGNQT